MNFLHRLFRSTSRTKRASDDAILHSALGSASTTADNADANYPSVLLIDWTAMGGGAATGELKSVYFQSWPNAKFAHLYAGAPRCFEFRAAGKAEVLTTADEMLRCARECGPDVILYRPVADRPDFHAASVEVIRSLALPYAIWLMDDWPERLRIFDPTRHVAVDSELRGLLNGSSANFAISESMAEAFAERYGVAFEILRNGVKPQDWEKLPPPPPRQDFVVRYAGSLAEDTTRATIELVAEAVETLSVQIPARFEIRTQRWWLQSEGPRYQRFSSTTIAEALTGSRYREWLAGADVLLVAYNFDQETHRYLKYSFANKIPECLASGAPVLLVGPENLSSVALLAQSNTVEHVPTNNAEAVVQALRLLASSPERRRELGALGRQFAFANFDLETQRQRLRNRLGAVAAKHRDRTATRTKPIA